MNEIFAQIKSELANVLDKFIAEYQTSRAKISDEDVKKFMQIRKLETGFAEQVKKDK